MIFTNAKYVVDEETNENIGIQITLDGDVIGVPVSVGNRHYDEIMRQVAAGDLTIADADPIEE